jgi:hypothetical protein
MLSRRTIMRQLRIAGLSALLVLFLSGCVYENIGLPDHIPGYGYSAPPAEEELTKALPPYCNPGNTSRSHNDSLNVSENTYSRYWNRYTNDYVNCYVYPPPTRYY